VRWVQIDLGADAEDADYVGLNEIRGVKVERFPDPSPARSAGLEIGDIVISIDGQPVQYTAQLQQVVGFRKPGEVVKVEVARKGGVRRTFNVRLVASDPTNELAQNDSDEPSSPSRSEGASIETLGITVEPVTPTFIQEFDLNSNFRGLVVRDVAVNGPAEGRLFGDPRSPDVIVSIEGEDVRTEADLRAALRKGSAGIVTLEVYNPSAENGQGGRRVERVRLRR
jgi:serine protease Do